MSLAAFLGAMSRIGYWQLVVEELNVSFIWKSRKRGFEIAEANVNRRAHVYSGL